jgi:hypothetical protein
MTEWTDLGWFTLGIDQPSANLSGISFSGGIFSAVSSLNDPNFWLLDTGNHLANNLGKTGLRFPINTAKYKRLLLRMSLSGGGISASSPVSGQMAQVLWSNDTIYNGINTSNAFYTWPGWWVYSVNLSTLGTASGVAWSAATADSLRIDPVGRINVSMSLDWARLVEDSPALYRNIAWTGAGAVDIYLDSDTNSGNGFIGQLARSIGSSPYSFYVGGLPQGSYYVAISPAGQNGPYSYAPGRWDVNDIPRLTFTSPSPEGSSDDFATVQLGNAWDMDSLSDIDRSVNVSGMTVTNIPAVSESGASLGSVRVLQGTSVTPPPSMVGDPYVYPLWWQTRGYSYHIDSNRYRILTLDMGIAGDRDINAGSVARIVWKNVGELGENVSDDIILNHRSGSNVIQKLIVDMKTLALEAGAGSPSHTGWNGMVDNFRVDPHEFSTPRQFWIKSVKLTAFERANVTYTVRWNYIYPGSTPVSMALYYDSTGTGFSGTQIATGLDPATGSYAWNTSGLSAGNYYIYAVLTIGATVVNQWYAPWPVVIDHSSSPTATMYPNRSNLYFGATQAGSTVTPGQQVVVTVNGAGPVNWSVTTDQPWIVATPASGSGTGAFTVSIQNNALPSPATLTGLVTITSNDAINSPQFVRVTIYTYANGTTASPFGSFDTPANGATGVTGNIAVTGWALDDVGVSRVQIMRDPVAGEGAGRVYIGDAVFVPDARPDVAAAYPTSPSGYKSGWGYLMLTNFLPNPGGTIGNGTFKIYAVAVDQEGRQTTLGSKTITVDNAHAVKPFGTLDTPGQGATISGSASVNFGWALTPMPYNIPTNGSTMFVVVDGVSIGSPVYNQYRSDIATLFPGYANSNGGVGYFVLDTTTMTNGMHNIAWSVTDSGGRVDGIGSRYFFVLNTTAGDIAAAAPAGSRDEEVGASTADLAVAVGHCCGAALMPLELDREEGRRVVRLKELEHFEARLPATEDGLRWTGALRVNGELKPLPVGSTFDDRRGIFRWQLGPGFLGRYELMFQRIGADGLAVSSVEIDADVAPRSLMER